MNPFPIVIESPADLWSGLDAILEYVEQHERERLSGAIRRLANVREVLFGASAAPVAPAVAPPQPEPVTGPPAGDPPPGKPTPSLSEVAREGDKPPRRPRLAPLILGALRDVPLSADQIGARIGEHGSLLHYPLASCHWFEKVDPTAKPVRGRPALWRLTEAGRAALASSTPTEKPAGPESPGAGSPETKPPYTTPPGCGTG